MSKAGVELGSGATIPVVDFGGFAEGDEATRRATATSIRHAFEDFGFLYVREHGVPQSDVDELFAQGRSFFALPHDAKARASGYKGLGWSGLDPSKPADVKERFRVPCDIDLSLSHWPEQFPGLRNAVAVFHEVGVSILRQLMHAVALSLGLPEEYFDAAHQPPTGTSVQLLHYPPIRESLLPGQLRSGAHTDFGTMSLLCHCGSSEGLEIRRLDGSWLHAPSLPGAVIVNVGDLLTRWTNGQLRSVLHRVVPPKGEAAQRSRYCAVLFYEPRQDVVIRCVKPCQSPERPALYPPITAGEHLAERRRQTIRAEYSDQ